MNTPADIANQALDAIGSEHVIGDLEEGSREARVCLRAYSQCMRQLLRAAHWNFARKQAPLTLLADATGQTSNVGTVVPAPWLYEYAYPTDCLKARFVPLNATPATPPPNNISIPATPPMQNLQLLTGGSVRTRAARFLEATDFNYVPPSLGDDILQQGVSPIGRTVILTNVARASLVYTAFVPYPSNWDPLFRGAMVAFLASEIALPLSGKDKKFGLELRHEQAEIAKQRLQQARIADGNEGFYSSDIQVDWMRIRNVGGGYGRGWDGDGPGVHGYGWDTISIGGTSAY